ncbi:MAG: hypothetical protein K5906_04185 [Bacilli bacterium]|nr:hypothetical protein [Bacilli bacterium]
MKKNVLFTFLAAPLLLVASCNNGTKTSSENSSETSGAVPSHDASEVQAYMDKLAESSRGDHFYLHYYRFAQKAEDYNKWDVWSWNESTHGEGYRFDWDGRETSADRKSATGNAIIDEFGYACVDIDLTREYDGGWNDKTKTMGGTTTSYEDCETIGFQIVESSTRTTGSSFWSNDGGDNKAVLDEFELTNADESVSYHVFVTQDQVYKMTATPPTEHVDPFEGDTGENYTYGKSQYKDAFKSGAKAKKTTSPLFLNGSGKAPGKGILQYGAGVGYQIMVSSFADSDGDGFGDILGIKDKLDYLEDLGVNVLWLTPIQMSDSYHGYDISDYTQVDPKFGSKASNHSLGVQPTAASAMEDYKDLIKAAHEKGMAVIMDLVLNHTSPTNKWFIKSAQLDADYRGYYQWGNHEKDGKVIKEENSWYPYGDHVYSYYAKFGSSMPELNYAYVSTRAAVATMACQWCEIGVDGFRMDAVKHIFMNDEVTADSGDTIIEDLKKNKKTGATIANYSSNLTKNLHFWRQLNFDVKSKYPNCFFVGENFDGHAYHVAPYYEGFDSLFDFYSYFNLTTMAAKSWGQNNDTINGGPSSGHAFIAAGSTQQGVGTWDLKSVLAKNKTYRGSTPINGAFTSNHDIARTINRIAGTGDKNEQRAAGIPASDGIAYQGNVTTAENYAILDKFATLVQIAEIMLPGCTWIYYGDELGMTGNFPAKDRNNDPFTSESAYADLYYRQPMKWVKSGKVGDGSYTTGYTVTGSSMKVEWDAINKSTTVKSVAEGSDHLNAIKAFAKFKGTHAAAIAYNSNFDDLGGTDEGYSLKIRNGKYLTIVNMNKSGSVGVPSGYSLVSGGPKYGTATNSSVSYQSAAVYES